MKPDTTPTGLQRLKLIFTAEFIRERKNPETSLFDYGNQSVRVRIIPYTTHSVEIAGWDGVFDILPFNSGYAVLDNAGSGGKPHRKALIAMSDIHRNFLEIKE